MSLYSTIGYSQALSDGDSERVHFYSVVLTNAAVTFANFGSGHHID